MFQRYLAITVFSVLSLLFSLNSASARNDFFGVNVLDNSKFLEALSNVRADSAGSTLYSINKNYADDSIYAYASIDKSKTITFSIVNKSKAPLKMNYFTDKYELLTTDGTVYELKKPDGSISNYPNVLNPNEKASVAVYGYTGKKEDIAILSALINFNKTFIALKKIEKFQLQKSAKKIISLKSGKGVDY